MAVLGGQKVDIAVSLWRERSEISLRSTSGTLLRFTLRIGVRAKGRDVIEDGGGYQLGEGSAGYRAVFEAEKADIGLEKTYFGNVKSNNQDLIVGRPKRPDRDQGPVTIVLKHTGFNFNTGFFSRNRDVVSDSSFSVLG